MQYFNTCTTIEEVKKLYKKLALENHPDRGGNTSTMQAINTEYAYACAKIAKGSGLSDEQADSGIKLSEEYRQVIEKIIHLPGIIIEIVGNWVWITGNTKPVKEELKAAGLFFARKKQAWYYRSDVFKTRGKYEQDMAVKRLTPTPNKGQLRKSNKNNYSRIIQTL